MEIAIRTDASALIGSGHVMRCLTFAGELSARGNNIHFICRELSGNLIRFIQSKGFPVVALSRPSSPPSSADLEFEQSCRNCMGVTWQQDLSDTISVVDKLPKPLDWLIVDHYELDCRWEEGIASQGIEIMVIDDLADRKHCCQVLLDQNFSGNQNKRYQELTSGNCKLLLGPDYALLRKEFSRAREERNERHPVSIKRILVFFGGVDATNETLKVLQAILLLKIPELIVDVLVGQQNPQRENLQKLCQEHSSLFYHHQPNSVADLMVQADLAVGAGGTFTWERCAVGLPALAWPVADNQKELLQNASQEGAVSVPTSESVASLEDIQFHLFALINNPSLCWHMSVQARGMCDGRGAARVAGILGEREIVVRKATSRDCDIIYSWRSNPDVRRFSGNARKFSIEEHRVWYAKALKSKDRILLIGEEKGEAVGIVRFDLSGDLAEVSIFMVPNLIGKGYGSDLLKAGENWLATNISSVNTVKAMVLKSNKQSRILFERAGYTCRSIVLKKQLRS